MIRYVVLRAGARSVIASIILTCLFAAGVGTGLWFQPRSSETHSGDIGHDDAHADESHADGDEHEEEEDHVALTRQAFENLGITLGQPTTGDYWKSSLAPGKVVEIPGRSDLAVSAPVGGVIEALYVVPGETITPQKSLFSIRVTDESILAAQTKYLDMLTQQAVAKQEIDRLAPLVRSGALTGTKKRELEYKTKQLSASQATLLQELRARGLPELHIENLIRKRQLASTVTVYTPGFVAEDAAAGTDTRSTGFSIEKIHVHPGKTVARGESLCSIAFHKRLYIEGTAFEADLPVLQQIASDGWTISVESFHESDSGESAGTFSLKLLRVDNHVDEVAQTVRFYLELPNEITRTLSQGKRGFEHWRFRPGQRVHLRLPVELWKDQLTLPVDAVVVDGPNAFVFAEHLHDHDNPEVEESDAPASSAAAHMAAPHATESGDEHAEDDHEHEIFIELEPVPVRLLYRDDKTAVIAKDGQLHDDDRIALDSAYKLYLAMQMQSGGGGGHHHHDH